MPVVPFLPADDRLWFRSHPDRSYRLRPAHPPETRSWPDETRRGLHFWVIVRAQDGRRIPFATRETGLPADNVDSTLEDLFDRMDRRPSKGRPRDDPQPPP